MKPSSALILAGTILMAALPVWSDTIPYSAPENGFQAVEFLVQSPDIPGVVKGTRAGALPLVGLVQSNEASDSATGSLALKFLVQAPPIPGFAKGAPAGAVALIGPVQSSEASNNSDSSSLDAPDTLLWFDGMTHPASFDELAMLGSSRDSLVVLSAENHGGDHRIILDPGRHHDRDIHHHPVALPEPETLGLVLAGLLGIGLLYAKRALVGRPS